MDILGLINNKLNSFTNIINPFEALVILAFSLFFGTSYCLGFNLYWNNTFSILFGRLFFSTSLMFIFMTLALLFIRLYTFKFKERMLPKYFWIIIYFILTFSYTIPLLMYFPGIGNNDMISILYKGISTSNQFPVFYCFYVLFFQQVGVWFGSLQYGIAFYTIVHILIVSILSLRLIKWVWNKKIPVIFKWLVLLYFVLNPMISMYAISNYKDPIFSLCLAGLCTQVFDLLFNQDEINEKTNKWLYIDLLVIILLRNNGSYIIAALILILFIFERRNEHVKDFLKKSLVILFSALVLSKGITALYADEQLFQEKIGIPLQQVCSVIVEEGNISEEDLNFMSILMPIEDIKNNYDAYHIDSIKWSPNFYRQYLNGHKSDFMKLWLRVCFDNPEIAIKAWLRQTFTYWCSLNINETESNDLSYSIWNLNDNFWLFDFLGENGVEEKSFIPEPLSTYLDGYYHLPLYYLYHGMRIWLTFMICILDVINSKKSYHPVMFYLPVILLWGTLIVAATGAFAARYALIFTYMLPIFIAMLFFNKNKVI